MSGVAVGVAAVMVTVAVGEGARREVQNRIRALGRDQIVVRATDLAPRPGRGGARALVRTLRPVDATRVADLPSVARVAPSQDFPRPVKYGRLSLVTTIRGTTPDYGLVRDFPAARGRYFTDEENTRSERVAVIGERVRVRLFGDTDPLGQVLRVGGVPFEIVGVLAPKGAGIEGGSDEDDQVLVPLRTALRRIFNVNYLNLLFVQVAPGHGLDQAEADIAGVLRRAHRLGALGRADDFAITNPRLVIEAELAANAQFRRLILAVGGVALGVGGVGILSILLLSVRERRGEIGLRMAVGARVRDVRRQFLLEALLLGGAGAMCGLVAGLAAAVAVGWGTRWDTAVTWESVGVAVGAAVAVTLLFGVWPARRAAALDPIVALQAE